MGTFLREKYPLLQGNLASLDQRVALTEPFKWDGSIHSEEGSGQNQWALKQFPHVSFQHTQPTRGRGRVIV